MNFYLFGVCKTLINPGSAGNGFKKLTDPAKLNVKPDRVMVKKVPRNMTLAQAFDYFKVPKENQADMAIINGMELSDNILKNTLLKAGNISPEDIDLFHVMTCLSPCCFTFSSIKQEIPPSLKAPV